MDEKKPEAGRYSKMRTKRGNVQVGRLKGKSHLAIAMDMQNLVNLNKHNRAAKKKFKAALKKDLIIKKNQVAT